MGNLLAVSAPTYPTSTQSLCVLPLRTNGQSRFSIASGPMPRQLGSRLAEAEYQGVISSVNTSLQPLSSFGVFSLLLPFLIVDVLTMVLLSAIDPWLLISPWDYPIADLLLPMGLEFGVIFCSFPLMAFAVNRRMSEVRRRVSDQLDDSSRRFGSRGLSFQLKQGILSNGAGTNMWVEVQITPVVHVQSPVPVPVPALMPLLLPSNATPAVGAAAAATAGSAAASGGKAPAAAGSSSSAAAGSSSTAAAGSSAAHAAAAASTADAPAASPPMTPGAGMTAEVTAQNVEYLRVLQENQLLRQYLSQTQGLLKQLMWQQQHMHMHMQAQAPNAAAAANAAAPAGESEDRI